MQKYSIEIDVSNLLVEIEGSVGKYGFITFRFVEADDVDAAVNAAVQMIHDDERLSSLVQNDENDPPKITIDEISELESIDDLDGQPGFIWYEMNPKRWWQFWRQ